MFRRALTRFLRLVANTFFRRIEVVGSEHIPGHGAVIFAGNHPNALVDGLLLISRATRSPIHFLGNAKLWRVPLLSRVLDALGTVPVYPREDHGSEASNEAAFRRVHQTLAEGGCIAIFPEGISHAGSQLTTLKTGTARMAFGAASRAGVRVAIVPFGLTYVNRHRFRSQALLHFGEPLVIDDERLSAYLSDEYRAVRQLTDELRERLLCLTLNAPDWDTLRFIHTARRLYKPRSAELTPESYVELSRRFVDHYNTFADEPEIQRLRSEIEDYQAQLDLLGLQDYQLSHPLSLNTAMKRIAWRSCLVILLSPLAVPGALILLPVAWLAATVGSRLSYDFDDIATLKVATAVLLLLLIYLSITLWVGIGVGWGWALVTLLLIPASFFATLFVLEQQAQLLASMRRILRFARLGEEIGALKARREALVKSVRSTADSYADPTIQRMFDTGDFRSP